MSCEGAQHLAPLGLRIGLLSNLAVTSLLQGREGGGKIPAVITCEAVSWLPVLTALPLRARNSL